MRLELKKFGNILSSRPAGKEVCLAAKAHIIPKDPAEKMEVNFSGGDVFTPSWADEFLTSLLKEYGGRVSLLPYHSPTVAATLDIIKEQPV